MWELSTARKRERKYHGVAQRKPGRQTCLPNCVHNIASQSLLREAQEKKERKPATG